MYSRHSNNYSLHSTGHDKFLNFRADFHANIPLSAPMMFGPGESIASPYSSGVCLPVPGWFITIRRFLSNEDVYLASLGDCKSRDVAGPWELHQFTLVQCRVADTGNYNLLVIASHGEYLMLFFISWNAEVYMYYQLEFFCHFSTIPEMWPTSLQNR